MKKKKTIGDQISERVKEMRLEDRHNRYKFSESYLKRREEIRQWFRENPFTMEMLEELRKGNSVRVDAGRR